MEILMEIILMEIVQQHENKSIYYVALKKIIIHFMLALFCALFWSFILELYSTLFWRFFVSNYFQCILVIDIHVKWCC